MNLFTKIALYLCFQSVSKKEKKKEEYIRQVLNYFNSTPLEFLWPTKTIP